MPSSKELATLTSAVRVFSVSFSVSEKKAHAHSFVYPLLDRHDRWVRIKVEAGDLIVLVGFFFSTPLVMQECPMLGFIFPA